MFPEAVCTVRELRPQGFIFENMKGWLRKSFASYFNYKLLQLSHPEITASDGMDWPEHLKLLEEYHTSGSRDGLEYNVVFPACKLRRLRCSAVASPNSDCRLPKLPERKLVIPRTDAFQDGSRLRQVRRRFIPGGT
jgi:hypothetical protein